MIRRARDESKRPRLSKKAREAERRAAAHGVKPIENRKELALGTPEDADELLDAIREMRRESGEL